MATSVVFALLDAVYDKLAAELQDVHVVDGPTLSQENGDFVMVGVDDPDKDGSSAADGNQVPGPFGTNRPRDDDGEIVCAIAVLNGDTDVRTARRRVAALSAQIEAIARTDPTWGGVTGLLWTGYGSSYQFTQAQDDDGAFALLVFRISYRARI